MNLAILDDVSETINAWNYFVKPATCTVNSEDIQQTNIVRRIRIVNRRLTVRTHFIHVIIYK